MKQNYVLFGSFPKQYVNPHFMFVFAFKIAYNSPTFRKSRTGFMNIVFGSIVGFISGNYMFAEPMKLYWEEQQQLQLQQQAQTQQQISESKAE